MFPLINVVFLQKEFVMFWIRASKWIITIGVHILVPTGGGWSGSNAKVYVHFAGYK